MDDARLVVLNAIGACELGADIRTRTRLVLAQRDAGEWRLTLADASGKENVARARALVNATGPWVKQVRDLAGARSGREGVAHVKGSHIVVPRVHDEPHAYILQNPDNRIIFVIPYEERFSLIGTTDIPVEAYEQPVHV